MNPLNNLDLSAFDKIWTGLFQEYEGLQQANYFDKSNLLNMESFSIVGFFQSLMNYAVHEVRVTFSQFQLILIFLLVVAIFQNVQSSFSNRYKEVTYTVLKLVLMVQLLQLFIFYHDYTLDVLMRYINIVIGIFPVLISLVAVTGAFWNHAIFQPPIIFLINASYFFVNVISLPLTVSGTVFGFINRIGPKDMYSQLINLVNRVALWSLGGYFAFFLALLSIQNVTLSFSNGLFFKGTQSLVNHIPIIGPRFTDTLMSVASTLAIMRNSVGLLSVITLVIFIVFPIIKIVVAVVLFRLLTAVLQPLISKEFIQILNVFNTGLMNLLVIMIIIGVMFIFTFFIILYSSNLILR